MIQIKPQKHLSCVKLIAVWIDIKTIVKLGLRDSLSWVYDLDPF